MCGITGIAWNTPEQACDAATLRPMLQAIVHRGPDDAGMYFSTQQHVDAGSGVALGFRRLSIIDLAGGHQPLANEDESVWIVFNGEIYNYRELHAELVQQGHRFRTASDTEVIVHLYEQYGTKCVERLRGMFAFAIWDQTRRKLFLARDRLGKKPLVYRLEPQRLLFASELKALLQIPGIPRELDPQAVANYLTYQYVPAPQAILKGFAQLPPAHWALYEHGKLRVERYWTPDFNRSATSPPVPESYPQAQQHLRELLTEAVRLRLRSDVPLGAFLSGGVDSSVIAGLMQRQSERPVQTFSIGFPVKAFDEREYAREAARHLGTEHHEYIVDPSALEMLPKLIWHYDQPFADSSAIPMMYLSRMTRERVTVALSGDGGDELFAGYPRYRAVSLAGWADWLPRPLRRLLAAPLWQKIPGSVSQRSRIRKLKRLLSALALDPQTRYLKWVSIFDTDRLGALLTSEFQQQVTLATVENPLKQAYEACPERDFVTRTTCADVLTYLPGDILTKVDIASMAYSLEVRNPFLDHQVVDFAARLPIHWKMTGRMQKKILVETFSELLPQRIQTRAKMGFGVPLDHWFRGELRPFLESILLAPQSLERGIFRPEAVRQLLEEHQRQQWDHSYRLWSLLCLELWQRTYLDPVVPQPISI